MPHVLVQHMYQPISGLPEDLIVNAFHFDSAAAVDKAAADVLAGLVVDFYEDIPGTAPNSIAEWIAEESLGAPAHLIKIYNMGDAKPRVPVTTFTAPTVTAGTVTPMAGEVACCLSFKAAVVSGVNAARRRGRVFIGPLNVNAGTVVAGRLRPNPAMRNSFVHAGRALANAAAAQGHTWSVYSPTTAEAVIGGGGDFPLSEIAEFWVDDAFDTIRSRGVSPTSRTTLTVAA